MTDKSTVLIVDDSSTIREHLRSILEKEFNVVTANDGQEGFVTALRSRPSAIVSDLEMPGMDGVELLRTLRAHPGTKSIPVIVATTVGEVSKMVECRSLGCEGFILKPVEGEYLLLKLKRILSAAAAPPPSS